MPLYRLPIPSGSSIGEPVCYLPVAQGWRHILVGLIERGIWDNWWAGTDEEIEGANAQIAAWIDILEGCMNDERTIIGLMFEDFVNPYPVSMTFAINANNYQNGYWYNPAAEQNIAIMEGNLWLAAGTYNATLFWVKSSSIGKFKWYVNGVASPDAQIMDGYSAAVQYNQRTTVSVVVPTSGITTLSLRNVGKNAASSNYYLTFNSVLLYRTL